MESSFNSLARRVSMEIFLRTGSVGLLSAICMYAA